MAFDLLIKNGTVVDGSGGPRYRADVGVKAGRITEIGRIRASAERVIDAEGKIVSPGFIDGHTHMDAQVNWDPLGSCSCWHGVTSVVMGNCGFALAPCKPDAREWFAQCLEAVEDIPTEAMVAGIDWNWETFPEYLANVEALPKGLNYGSYIGHSALRMYVMGERALTEEATDDDLAQMAAAVQEALRAGAMGFSSSRANTHIRPDGGPVASRIANWQEIAHLVDAMAELNAGIFQVGPDVSGGEAQRAFMQELRTIAINSGRPVMLGTLSTAQGDKPNPWEYQLEWMDEIVSAGARVFGQSTTRSINAIFSLKSYLPFDGLPNWKGIRALPLEEQKARFRDPDIRAKLIADEAGMKPKGTEFQGGGAATTDPRRPDYGNLFPMFDVMWDDPSVADLARTRNQNPIEVMIDLVLENEDQMFVQPLVNEKPDDVLGMLRHPRTLATFSDSGAHVCQEMGSSLQTHLLSYWVREKQAFTLEEAVRMLTFDNASAWEMNDRGMIRAGLAADILVFDADTVKPCLPTVQTDLPGGARRLVQKAEGISETIVNGQITLKNGEATGAVPGQVIKGPLAA
ncbi:MAG: amidohydrolase family protein [Rhodospirillaceae bacterium]|jgi:N-acyl-D-amino-acid deacylase|nr:amidohydrolase family protein [Rhodospirillaceae bacterium]